MAQALRHHGVRRRLTGSPLLWFCSLSHAALVESLQLYRAIGSDAGMASCLVALAWLQATTHGSSNAAARLLAAAQLLRESTGVVTPTLSDSAEQARSLTEVRAQVGDPAVIASLAAAQLRSLDQVVADAVALAFERVG